MESTKVVLMARNLHSFTLTDDASLEVAKMKKRTKSAQVSVAICKYANDHKLTPAGTKFWQEITADYLEQRDSLARINTQLNTWIKELERINEKQGVFVHLRGLLKCLIPFRQRKREEPQEQQRYGSKSKAE